MAEERSKDRVQAIILGLFALGAIFALAYCISAFRISNLDIHWHLKTGEWIVNHGRVPDVDFFSFSREGMEWIDAQWLFQVLVFTVFDLIGEEGLTLLVVLLIETILVIVLFTASSEVPLGARTLCGVFFLLAINPRIVCRPELLTCVYMALFVLLLEKGRQRKWLLLLVPLVQVMWVNSQGLWPIGPVLVAAYIFDTLIESRLHKDEGFNKSLQAYQSAVFVLCVVAGFIQPYFVKGFLFPLTLLQEVTMESTLHKKTIADIQPLYTDPLVLRAAAPFLVFSAASIVVAFFTGRRIRPGLFLLSLVFIYLAVTARRNVSIASVIVASLLMIHLGAVFQKIRIKEKKYVIGWGLSLPALALALVFCILSTDQHPRTWDATFKHPGQGFRNGFYPEELARTLHSIGYKGSLLNNNRIGGYLIWSGWPDWKVFADPRMELGGEKALRQRRLVLHGGPAFRRVVSKYEVEAIALGVWKDNLRKLASRLYMDGEWALIHKDRPSGTVLFLKREPKWKDVIDEKEIKLEKESW